MTTDARMVEQAIRIARERVAKDGEEWWTIAPEYLARLADAAQAHLDTLPRTKTIDVWHLEYVVKPDNAAINVYRTEAEAIEASKSMPYASHVHVTGPHKHEVPA